MLQPAQKEGQASLVFAEFFPCFLPIFLAAAKPVQERFEGAAVMPAFPRRTVVAGQPVPYPKRILKSIPGTATGLGAKRTCG